MKIIINVIVLFLLLFYSASNASQPSESLKETPHGDIFQKHGTSNSPIFIQMKESGEEKRAKDNERADRGKNLEIQTELKNISE